MRACHICGNDDDTTGLTCRFCGAALEPSGADKRTGPLYRTINLKSGKPLVETALRRLEQELLLARADKVRVVSIIHGYGSSGKGGRIKAACREVLVHLVQRGELHGMIPGEEFEPRSGAGKNLLQRFPRLGTWVRRDVHNAGITIIIL